MSVSTDSIHLGDGVYAVVQRGMIRLCTFNGYAETNVIYLEPEVWRALLQFVAQAGIQ
jgi:hypothetical protein